MNKKTNETTDEALVRIEDEMMISRFGTASDFAIVGDKGREQTKEETLAQAMAENLVANILKGQKTPFMIPP